MVFPWFFKVSPRGDSQDRAGFSPPACVLTSPTARRKYTAKVSAKP